MVGTGTRGYGGDGGLAVKAYLDIPTSVAFDASGNSYITDTVNNVIRKVTKSTGIITTVVGVQSVIRGYSGDGGAATSAMLNLPFSVAFDATGNMYVADTFNNVIRKVVKSTGIITTAIGVYSELGGYGGDGGLATKCYLHSPLTITFDAAGNLYIADVQNSIIRMVTKSTGIIKTVAGVGMTSGYSGDGGQATRANLAFPVGFALDSSGNMYIADYAVNLVRKVTKSSGIITTVVGTGMHGYSGDNGPATQATLNIPYGMAFDKAGNLYLCDYQNSVVRKIAHGTGIITTAAGIGLPGYNGDGDLATEAPLYFPIGVAVDSNQNVYIADIGTNRVRSFSTLSGPTMSPTAKPVGAPTANPSKAPVIASSATTTVVALMSVYNPVWWISAAAVFFVW